GRCEKKHGAYLAEGAPKTNPRLTAALRLQADVHLSGGEWKAALALLDKARVINGREESTLGRLAACYLLQKKKADYEGLVRGVGKFDSKPGIFYYALAQKLEDRRRFDEALDYYKKAIHHRPMVPWPQNNLGLLYMRMGREKEGRESLEKAYKSDKFNVRVRNTLVVLDHL